VRSNALALTWEVVQTLGVRRCEALAKQAGWKIVRTIDCTARHVVALHKV
jgi:hypothetical protein